MQNPACSFCSADEALLEKRIFYKEKFSSSNTSDTNHNNIIMVYLAGGRRRGSVYHAAYAKAIKIFEKHDDDDSGA